MAFDLSEVQAAIEVPTNLNEDDLQSIGQACIEQIRKRCANGLDLKGRSFKYIKDSKFDGGNLEQSGDMLFTLEVISTEPGKVTIGYSDDSIEARKAHGNQTGSYGDEAGHPSKAKPFIGVTNDELELILANYNAVETPEMAAVKQTTNSFINSIFAKQGLLDEDE
jgi:hypothetical protein